jgi:hypothetical protein
MEVRFYVNRCGVVVNQTEVGKNKNKIGNIARGTKVIYKNAESCILLQRWVFHLLQRKIADGARKCQMDF